MSSWTRTVRGEEKGVAEDLRPELRQATPFVHWNLTQEVPELVLENVKDLETASKPTLGLLRFPSALEFRKLEIALRQFSQGAVTFVESDDLEASEPEPEPVAKQDSIAPAPKVSAKAPNRLDKPFVTGLIPLSEYALDTEPVGAGSNTPNWIPTDLAERVTGTGTTEAQREDLPKDTVIIGIIDDGLALGHARFRLPNVAGLGSDTRILAAWMQEGQFDDRNVVPFGRDIYRDEIRRAIRANTHGGWLDEEGFDRQIHPAPSSKGWSSAARQLAGDVVHGTHVLDLACGHDPLPEHADELGRQRIIAVALPGRAAIGTAGTYLEYFVVHGMRRIVEMADKLWQEIYPDDKEGGFDTVINLSYGQQSGTKSGTSEIEQEFLALKDARVTKAETRLVMPVGNDNLTRSNARWSLGKFPKEDQRNQLVTSWRILPQDQSPNFVEVWTDLTQEEIDTHAKEGFPLEICLCSPGEPEEAWIVGQDKVFFDNADETARIYASIETIPDLTPEAVAIRGGRINDLPFPDPLGRQLRYVVAMRPTLDFERPARQARAGLWKIKVRWRAHADVPVRGREIYINVQVDQNLSSASRTNFRSYFQHPNYRTHLPSGRALDSFAFLPSEAGLANGGINLASTDIFGHVQRQGSQNALSNHKEVDSVTGYRESDGRPADFAATYYATSRRPDVVEENVSGVPKKSYPVDNGAVHLGILAAGPRSGSMRALRGTSFAAPQETRTIIEALRSQHRGDFQGDTPVLRRGKMPPSIERTVVETKEGKEKEAGYSLSRVDRRGQ